MTKKRPRRRYQDLREKEQGRLHVASRPAVAIRAELSQDKKRELLFRARTLLVAGLWALPPRQMIRKLVAEIDQEIDREALVGCMPEQIPLD